MDLYFLSPSYSLVAAPLLNQKCFLEFRGASLIWAWLQILGSLWIFTNLPGGMRSTLSKLRLKRGTEITEYGLSLVEEDEDIRLRHDHECGCVKPEPFFPSFSVKRQQEESFSCTSVSLSGQRPPVGGNLRLYFVSFSPGSHD